MAWPNIIRDIEWDASAGSREDCENLQDEIDDLHHQLSDASKALDREQGRAAYYKSELKKYQKPQSDTTEVMMSQPKATPIPLVALSSRMMLDSPIKENPNDREILGMTERISLDTLPASQAASISYVGDKVITHRLLDITAPRDHDEFMDDLREEAGYDPELGDRRLREAQEHPPK